MTFEEDYLELVGQIGNFTEDVTGISIIDAYFGPRNLSPEKAERRLAPEKLLTNLNVLIEQAKESNDELRRIALTCDIESLKVVVKWLSGDNIPYTRLVEGIIGITPTKFGQKEILKAQQQVEDTCATLPGPNVSAKILKWEEENKISGEMLKKKINTEMVERTQEIKSLYEKRIFTHFQTKVENKGVIYKTVTGQPWFAYNYYEGDYTSINVFNIDMPFNKYRLIHDMHHEYEHHVANLFLEKYYRETRSLDLSAVLMLTKRGAISEGTAECAKDFLDLQKGEENAKLIENLDNLRWLVNLNAAYMLNVENLDDEMAAEYMTSEGFEPIEEAKKWIEFSRPLASDGRPNFFKPYIYTYFLGKRDYVLPTFQKAQRKDKLREFFQTLYLNPYSRSTATWKIAFSKI